MNKCIIYTRFSPRPESDSCQSCDVQEALCRDWATKNNLEVMELYADKASSGGDIERDGLWLAMKALKRGWTLVVYRLDRLSRDVYLSATLQKELDAKGCTLKSVAGEGTEKESDEARMIRQIISVINEYARKCGAARTKTFMRHYMAQGKRMGGDAANQRYGLMVDPKDTAKIIPNPLEVEHINLVMDLERQGMSTRQIAGVMNSSGYLHRGSQWNMGHVQRLLVAAGVRGRK